MALWREHVVPRLTDVMLGTGEVRGHRERVITGLQGEMVEIGFGSGLNVPLYPAEVQTVYAVDPSEVGRKLATRRLDASRVPIRFVGLDGQDLPLDDESVDAALSTFTLCTIPDVEAALRELHRVLRPGGAVHALEHGLAPDRRVAAWQHRLDGLQGRFAAGCHLVRDAPALLAAAGYAPRLRPLPKPISSTRPVRPAQTCHRSRMTGGVDRVRSAQRGTTRSDHQPTHPT